MQDNGTDAPPRSPLLAAVEFLQEIRRYDPEMPAHHAEALLVVARYPGIIQQDLVERLGVSKSTVSRIYQKLGDAEGGCGLIAVRDDPDDRRRKMASLTSRGKAFVARVFDLMGL